MNEKFSFDDTFDNLSFSESGRCLKRNSNLSGKLDVNQAVVLENNINNKLVVNTISVTSCDSIQKQESTNGECLRPLSQQQQNISVDDSVFLNESLSLCEKNFNCEGIHQNVSVRNNEENHRNVSIRNSEELFTDTPEKNLNTTHSSAYNNDNNKENVYIEKVDASKSENLTPKEALSSTDSSLGTDNCDLSAWGLPDPILQKYKDRGIVHMFPWQVKCLSNPKLLENNANLVYSAPTSAGKTLVAEILAIKTVLERRKKVLFILPFISVVREKMFYFQDILGSSGVRVEGFMGSHNPPGGFQAVQVAICTIEKANGIINRLLEEGALADVGAVIVDEMHLLGDSSRGYLLELMLTKLQYMTIRFENIHIQIIGMSATLPNLDLLGNWLKAELYVTDFRPIPLYEQCLVNGEIYNKNLILERHLLNLPELEIDTDNILQLCLETIQNSCSVLIFCPTKNWCENLAQQIAVAFWKLGCSKTPFGLVLRQELNRDLISELIEQLKRCPVGLDKILHKTTSYGVAFHHAGLTMDERDIIEAAFRNGVLRVLVATSTLSSGVNLPARRVIIRTPMFHGKPIDSLVYRQMIGRAGRMGKDTSGESILICQKNDYRIAKELLSAKLQPIESCLEGAGKLKRAILEVVASGVAATPDDVKLFTKCTLLAASEEENEDVLTSPIDEAIEFLTKNEFIRLQKLEDGSSKYIATSLGKACLSSSMPPEEGLALFAELEKARQCFVLETELHLIYLVTPYSVCNQWGNLDWMLFLELWEKLPSSMKRVGELVGIRESYIINGTRNKIQTSTSKLYQKLQIHRRFFTALALQDLVNELPLNDVAIKFGCSRGMLQSLQQSASTFAGMLTIFSRHLGWSSVEILISQFQDRLHFGVNRDLLDLMRLPILNGPRARALYNAGIETLVHLASSDIYSIENVLHKVGPFESEKEREGESEFDTNKRNKIRGIWVTGKEGLTEREAAVMLIQDARRYLQLEMGLAEAKWEETKEDEADDTSSNDSLKNEQKTEKVKVNQSHQDTPTINTSGALEENKIQTNSRSNSNTKEKSANSSKHEDLHSNVTFELKLLSVEPNLVEEKPQNNDKHEDLDSNVSCELNALAKSHSCVEENAANNNKHEDLDSNISFELRLSSSSESLSISNDGIEFNANANKFNKSVEQELNDKGEAKIEDRLLPPHNNILSTSDQSLFGESFELNEQLANFTVSSIGQRETCKTESNSNDENSSNNVNSGDSGLDFENGSFLENAFVSSFDLEPETSQIVNNSQVESNSIFLHQDSLPTKNKSKIVSCEDSSPSNDFIVNSQPDVVNSIMSRHDSMKSSSKILSQICRKRERREKENIYKSSIVDEDESLDMEETTTKRRKTQACKKIVTRNLCLFPEKSTPALSCKSENSTPVDLTKLQIIDVCNDEKLFKTFCAELFEQKIISLSFACTKTSENKPIIGTNILRKNTSKDNTTTSPIHEFVYKDRQVMGLAVTWSGNVAYYISFENKIVSNASTIDMLKKLFSHKTVQVRIFDSKEQIKVAKLCCDLDFSCVAEDPKVADWLIEPEGREKNLQAMAVTYAPEAVSLSQLAGNCKGVGSTGLDLYSSIEPRIRAAVEAVVTWHLCDSICDVLAEQNVNLLQTYKTEMSSILCLTRMELNGLGVNMAQLQALAYNLKYHTGCLEKQAYALAGRHFSFTSSADVAKVLGMYKGRKVSTNKQTLEQQDNPIASLILQWRKLNCTLTKMVYPLIRLVHNGRIYGSCVTHNSTGRISMHEPNLQNVARDFEIEDGLKKLKTTISCRAAFVPKDTYVFLSADYCQLELRLLAHLSQDPLLCSIMKSGEDVFRSVAAKWKNVQEAQVDDVLRQWAKQLCYGIIYGMGTKALAEQLSVSEEDAAEFIDSFRNRYPNIKKYIQETISKCKDSGYVETLAGRRRYLPNINHQNSAVKSQAERQAVNTTVQGSAADLAKLAMVLIEERFGNKFRQSKNLPKLVLHLHDELLYEVQEKYLVKTANILKKSMEEAVKLSVPFPVKLKSGSSWGTMKELVL